MGQGEPDDLAALLLILKERSGLSYGMLARRLHLSTSTVHRYCSGETVPLDYAPVERFARLGRATPAELEQLHRQWVLANERRLGRDTGRPPRAPAEPATPPEPEPTPEVAIPVEATPPARPPARRGRPWVVAALITAALVLAVAVPVAARELRHTDRDRKGVALQPVEARPSTSPSAGDSVPPTEPSRPPTTAAGRSSGAPVPKTNRTSTSSSSTPSGDTRLDTGPPPLNVTVTPYDRCLGRMILVNRPPEGVTPPPEVANTSAWVKAFDGIQARGQEISVLVQGKSDQTVVLNDLHVRTMAVADPPTAGSVYNLDDGCGGGVPTTAFSLNLDAPHPEPRSPKVHALPRKVSQGDPERLLIDTTVEAHDVTWYLELEWSSGNRHGTMRIDDHGRPFRNTGVKGRPEFYFDYDAHEWKPI